MKIITWNCNMAFRKKAAFILEHQPDILIVPECEHPDKLKFDGGVPEPTDVLWFGANTNKGLGIFSYSGYKFKLRKTHNPELKMIIPIAVSRGDTDFTLYAVWANNPTDPDGVYVEQIWKALHHYDKHLKRTGTMLIGDFNSNTIWDRPKRIGNHTDVVRKLAKKGIHSAYHHHHKQEQGKEEHPTQYMYRHKDKPYHLDYCFASQDLIDRIKNVEIGRHQDWTKHSDHMPIIVTFED